MNTHTSLQENNDDNNHLDFGNANQVSSFVVPNDTNPMISNNNHYNNTNVTSTTTTNHSSIPQQQQQQQQQQHDSTTTMSATPTPFITQQQVELQNGGLSSSSSSGPSTYEQMKSSALRPFIIISTSYLLFTITDGAIRMIVLLHAYNKSFTALEVAIMFTLYEVAGVGTNLAAGILGSKWGIKFTLVTGLILQLISYGVLFAWSDDWSKRTSLIFVTCTQLFAGVAKDLTKLGGKTVTKLVTPDEQTTKLFKLVSFITGWKNSLKGVGYFLGSALLEISYEVALFSMMGLILLAMPWAICSLDQTLGTTKKKSATWSEIFCMDNTNLNVLSLARLFLFASRDFWFEVPLPFFLRSPRCTGLGTTICTNDNDCYNGAQCPASTLYLFDNNNTTTYYDNDNNNNIFQNNVTDFDGSTVDENRVCQSINTGGGCGGLGMNRVWVGAMLGGYIILYGQIQSWTPQLVTGPLQQTPPNKYTEILWGCMNCIPTLIGAILLNFDPSFGNTTYNETIMTSYILVILISFAIIFAINSSIHSYLVVKYAAKDKVAVSVGFYYMSNALGRLFGTIGSGLLYTYVGDEINDYSGPNAVQGLVACFTAGTLSSLVAAIITFKINDNDAGLLCGSCYTIVEPTTSTITNDNEQQQQQPKDDEHELLQQELDSTGVLRMNGGTQVPSPPEFNYNNYNQGGGVVVDSKVEV